MAIAQRLRGSEVAVLVVRDGSLEDTITDIQSASFESQVEIITQGYLGEKSNRKDEIFNGVSGKLDLHIHDQAWFTFEKAILDRAMRVTPDVIFNITMVASFPNGQTNSVLIPDVKWGPIPHDLGGRNEYLKISLTFEAETYQIQQS